MNMTINFNNVRKQAVYSYDRLTKILNAGILKESIMVEKNGGYEDCDLCVNSDDIQDVMDNLRALIMTIAMTYEEGNEDFKDMTDEIDKSGEIAHFNYNEDEK